MATEKPRFTITLSEDLFEKVNEYQHSMRFSTQTKAIVDLIEHGLEALGLIPCISESFTAQIKNASPDSDEAMDLFKSYIDADPGIQLSVRKLLDLDPPQLKMVARGSRVDRLIDDPKESDIEQAIMDSPPSET